MNPRRCFRLSQFSFVISLMIYLSLLPSKTFAQKIVLESLFKSTHQVKKSIHGKSVANKTPVLTVPSEYEPFFNAKSVLQRAKDLKMIEQSEDRLLRIRLISDCKALNRESEDLFYALEIKRAEKLAKKKSWFPALKAFSRGLNGLSTFKWPLYWSKNSSVALNSVCTHKKHEIDENCLFLAKKVVDLFPKPAGETEPLRGLPFKDLATGGDVGGDRLSQSYSEKVEKDEQAFDEVLQAYLNQNESDLSKTTLAFNEAYPKSGLRFRAAFLMAELQNQKKEKKQAEINYRMLIEQTPLSFYALVAADRLGVSLTESVSKEPIEVDPSQFNLNPAEKESLKRAQALIEKNHREEAEFELESLSRTRSYSNDFLLYFSKLAHKADLNLQAFKALTELIQRKYDGLLQTEVLEMIFPDRFQKEIEKESIQDHIAPVWVTSLMKQESGFKPQAISSSGALGLMQLMPFTAIDTIKDLELADLKIPASNIEVGTTYIASLFEKYDGNPVYALAAYNAGPHRVAKWKKEARADLGMIGFIEAIPFKETREYVMAILRNRYWYQYRRGVPTASVFDSWKP